MTTSSLTERQDRVLRAIESARTATRKTSEFIHANPEVAMTEEKSSAALADLMEEFGFDVERGAGGVKTAFVARRGSGSTVIGFLAEYDALPGVDHGCGHNPSATGCGYSRTPSPSLPILNPRSVTCRCSTLAGSLSGFE